MNVLYAGTARMHLFVAWPLDRLLACPGVVFKSAKAMIGKAPPPAAHDARLNTYFFGNRTRAAALSRQQNYPLAIREGGNEANRRNLMVRS